MPKPKPTSQNQIPLDFDKEEVSQHSLRDLYIEQIKRDTRTLREGGEPPAPSREFYEQRIASFREAVMELDANK